MAPSMAQQANYHVVLAWSVHVILCVSVCVCVCVCPQESTVAGLKGIDVLLGWVSRSKGGRDLVRQAIDALQVGDTHTQTHIHTHARSLPHHPYSPTLKLQLLLQLTQTHV